MSRTGETGDEYTFGTNPTAAHRLDLLAEVFEPHTRALLARQCPEAPDHALDLGAGPGHTTVLLHAVSGAARTTGVERSPDFLARARAEAPEGVTYVEADVTRPPLPVPPADVVHARFLITHLADPVGALETWAGAARPGAPVLMTEVARLVSREPSLARYYEMVAELQAHHGQALDIGTRLSEIAKQAGVTVVHHAVRSWNPPLPAMAALHVLNLRTWRDHDYARGAFDPDELDALEVALAEIAHGGPSAPVEQDLVDLVVTRD